MVAHNLGMPGDLPFFLSVVSVLNDVRTRVEQPLAWQARQRNLEAERQSPVELRLEMRTRL